MLAPHRNPERWVDIPCPQCGKRIEGVNANALLEISWPKVEHGCGYLGPIKWINPDRSYLLALAHLIQIQYRTQQSLLASDRS